MSLIRRILLPVILILRTNALYDGNKRVLWTFGIMCPVLAVVGLHTCIATDGVLKRRLDSLQC